MNRSERITYFLAAGVFLLISGTLGCAKDKPAYQAAKLVDFRAYPTGSGSARAQYSFCLAIQVGDIAYTVNYETFLRGSYQPTNLVVGDSIEIRTKGNDLYFKTGASSPDEVKAHITRRERITPDSKPATCALPVSVDH
jgi:hypothetical protein